MIQLSPTAIGEVQRLRRKYSSIDSFLRIDIDASGCKGLSYQIEFSPSPLPDDQMFDCGGEFQVLVSSNSLQYISGLTLDYTEDMMGGSFRFYNPNASETCSCGHSFATTLV